MRPLRNTARSTRSLHAAAVRWRTRPRRPSTTGHPDLEAVKDDVKAVKEELKELRAEIKSNFRWTMSTIIVLFSLGIGLRIFG